jgi:hypothetical protein
LLNKPYRSNEKSCCNSTCGAAKITEGNKLRKDTQKNICSSSWLVQMYKCANNVQGKRK